MERILAVIEHENPDLICLQEVDRNVRRSRYEDQPELLGEYFKAAGKLFQLNVELKEGGYGNLFLSRWPIQRYHQLSLRLNSKKPRGAQIAIVDTPEGPLRVVNHHLGLSDYERHWQVGHLLEHRVFREGHEMPTVIAGDTNDWRNTLASGALGTHGFEQATTPPSRFRSFPAYLAMGSLDKFFYRGSVQVSGAHIVHSPTARQASDHLPLVVDFHLVAPESNGQHHGSAGV